MVFGQGLAFGCRQQPVQRKAERLKVSEGVNGGLSLHVTRIQIVQPW